MLEQDSSTLYDAIVVGGGPAGLSAGLWLARYHRRVRVIDANDPRNMPTWAVHGYLGLEDPAPTELRRIGREQATRAGAETEAGYVQSIEGSKDSFRVTLSDQRVLSARRVLLCTGLKDIIPEIPGLGDFYGSSIWHCPDCDGPSVVDKRVGVIGWGEGTAKLCLYLLTWTEHLTVLTHSQPHGMNSEALAALAKWKIPIRQEAIERLEGEDGCVRRAVFHDGSAEEFDAMFFHIACGPGSTLAADLGCETDVDHMMEGVLQVDGEFETTVPGVYAAGDLVPGSRLAIRAASEGLRAALGIHKSLIPADRRL